MNVRRNFVNDLKHCAFRADGKRVAVCYKYGGAMIDPGAKTEVFFAETDTTEYSRAAFNLGGTLLTTVVDVAGRGAVQLRNADDGRLEHHWVAEGYRIVDWSFSPDGKEAALGGSLGKEPCVLVREYRTGKQRLAINLRKYFVNSGEVMRIVWTPDGKHLAVRIRSLFGQTRLFVFDARTGQEKFVTTSLNAASEDVALAASPDGMHLAVGGSSGAAEHLISLWSIQTGQLSRELKGHMCWIRAWRSRRMARVWFPATEAARSSGGTWAHSLVHSALDRQAPVAASFFTRKNGAFAATVHSQGDLPGTLKLWDLATGELKRSWNVTKDFVGACLIHSGWASTRYRGWGFRTAWRTENLGCGHPGS